MKNIHNFPNLPVPDLVETMNKFLVWAKPLLTQEQLAIAQTEVDNFLNSNTSKKLQDFLVNKAQGKDSNWLIDWWIKYVYLMTRGPTALECNGSMILNFGEKSNLHNYIIFAAFAHKIAEIYLDFKLNGDPLIPFGKVPMSLDQYEGTFAGMRLPNKNVDDYYINQGISENVILVKNNITYSIPVIRNKEVVSIEEIARNFEYILKKVDDKKLVDANFITAHTNRDEAKDFWDEIEKLGNNASQLKIVKDAIVAFNFDDISCNSSAEYLLNYFYGPNYNRWHGKGMNFITTKDHVVGLIADHTYQDGGTGTTIMIQIVDYLNKIENFDVDESISLSYQKINFELTNSMEQKLLEIEKDYVKHLKSINLDLWKSSKINRVNLKNSGIVSVDAFIQLIFQMAQYYANKKIRNTYISVDLRSFYMGRTECVRPVSEASKTFVENWFDGNLKNEPEKIHELLKEIMDVHHQRVKDCQHGHGINRHMLGLYLAYVENASEMGEMPKLFETEAWKIISANPISTSSIVHPIIDSAFFYPVHPEGIGIFYSVNKERMQVVLSSWVKDSQYHQDFLLGLEKSVDELAQVLNIK